MADPHFTDIPDPVADLDAVNKRYVDDNIGGGGVPAGGTTGQQLTKDSNADFDVSWAAAGGSGGGTSGGFRGVNHQTGTLYYVLSVSDKEKLITLNNAAAVSVILPATSASEQLADSYDPGSGYAYTRPMCMDVTNGSAGHGQSFTCNHAGFITRARFLLKRTGSPTGNAVANLYSHDGTYGTSSVPLALLATSDPLDVTTISTTATFYDLTFSTPYTLEEGIFYIITIEWTGTGADTSNSIGVAHSTALGHSGNAMWYIAGGSVFGPTVEPAWDLAFYVYTTGDPTMDDTWVAYFENLGAGLVTISTVDSAIDDIASVPLRQDTGIIIACDGTAYYTCRGVGLGTEKLGITVRVSGSDFTTSSTTLVDITGLSFPAIANTLYDLDIGLKCHNSTTDGLAVGINYSASGATVTWAGIATSNGIAIPGAIGSTTLNAHGGAFGSTSTKDSIVSAKGYLTTGANPGSITVKIMEPVGGTATVYIGSRMTVTKL